MAPQLLLAASLKTVCSALWKQMACWSFLANILLLCWDYAALPGRCRLCRSGLQHLGPAGLAGQARREHKSQSQREAYAPLLTPGPLLPGGTAQLCSVKTQIKNDLALNQPRLSRSVPPSLLSTPLSGVHWGRGRNSRGAQLQRCRGGSSHPKHDGLSDDSGDPPACREQKLRGMG